MGHTDAQSLQSRQSSFVFGVISLKEVTGSPCSFLGT
jgi:hypothetical protein